MQNLIDQYTADVAEVDGEDGVVAIEYVVVAAAIAATLLLGWGAVSSAITGKLSTIVGNL